MRAAEKRSTARRRHAPRSSAAARSTASTAAGTPSTSEAGQPLVDDLGHRPARVGDDRRAAHHRLHHREPERLVEGHRVQQRRRAAQDRGALCRADRAEVAHPVTVDVRLDLLGEVALVLHDPAQRERTARRRGRSRSPRASPCRDGCARTRPARRRAARRTAGRRRRRRGAPWRVAQPGDAVARPRWPRSARRPLVGRQDARAREAVDRRHQRRPGEAGEGQRQPVEVAVDEVELARALEAVGDVQRLPDPAVERAVLLVRPLGDAVERARRCASRAWRTA